MPSLPSEFEGVDIDKYARLVGTRLDCPVTNEEMKLMNRVAKYGARTEEELEEARETKRVFDAWRISLLEELRWEREGRVAKSDILEKVEGG